MERVYRLFIDDGGHSALFKTEEAAIEEGTRYAEGIPHALVMLVELDMTDCENCDKKIVRDGTGILFSWKHLYEGTIQCWLRDTKAKPKEE